MSKIALVLLAFLCSVGCAFDVTSSTASQESGSPQACSKGPGIKWCWDPINTGADDICRAICQQNSYCGLCVYSVFTDNWYNEDGGTSGCPQTGEPPAGSQPMHWVCFPGSRL